MAGKQKMIAALEALKKPQDYQTEGHEAVACMKISGKKGGFMALFATHPSLDNRIKALQKANIA